jgi:hypothetical protein
MGYFRELTGDELELVAGGDGETIVVTGTRLIRVNNNWGSTGWDDPGSSSQPVPPDCTCGMNGDEQAQVDTIADQEAAEVLREILAKANQKMEYGSIIYIDANGTITHTPLVNSGSFTTQLDWSAVPKNADGTTDFSRVLGVVHSHPQYLPNADGTAGYTNYYDPTQPDRLLYPSDRDDIQDDWDFYDNIAAKIAADGGDASQFSLYIAGYNGSTLALNQYFGNDKHTTTSSSGDAIDKDYTSPVFGCELHGG